MMNLNNNQLAFIALLNAGLWETECHLKNYSKLNFGEVYQIAEEQSVVGLIAAGLEHVFDIIVPKKDVLNFVGNALQLEQRNTAMNAFIRVLNDKMCMNGIFALLVKGQGVAQCYARPLWRACGDIDLFLDENNYLKAFSFLSPLASHVAEENSFNKHRALTIEGWEVELHGTLRSQLGNRIDKYIDHLQEDTFSNKKYRIWKNEGSEVYLPSIDNDILFIFLHILQHYYNGGIGLRQVCDLNRLLWSYKGQIDLELLKTRLNTIGLMSEWKAFASLSVNILGMPEDAMPLYSSAQIWKRKASLIYSFIIKFGSFGHNRDFSFINKYSKFKVKVLSIKRHFIDFCYYLPAFPLDTFRIWAKMVLKRSLFKNSFSVE